MVTSHIPRSSVCSPIYPPPSLANQYLLCTFSVCTSCYYWLNVLFCLVSNGGRRSSTVVRSRGQLVSRSPRSSGNRGSTLVCTWYNALAASLWHPGHQLLLKGRQRQMETASPFRVFGLDCLGTSERNKKEGRLREICYFTVTCSLTYSTVSSQGRSISKSLAGQ
jgi:hypothetical protein